jgi:hypothetical protein
VDAQPHDESFYVLHVEHFAIEVQWKDVPAIEKLLEALPE